MDHPSPSTEAASMSAMPGASSISLNDLDDSFDGRCMANRFITGIDGATGFIAGDRLSRLWMPADALADALGVDAKELAIFTATVNGMAHQAWRSLMGNERIDATRIVVALGIMESYCSDHPDWLVNYPAFPYAQFETAPVDGSALIRIGLDLSYLRCYANSEYNRIEPFLDAGLPSSRRGKTGPIPLTDAILAHAVRFVDSIYYWSSTHYQNRFGRMRSTHRRI